MCAAAQLKSLSQFDFNEVRSVGQHFSAFLILLLKYSKCSKTRLNFFKMGNKSGLEAENWPDVGVGVGIRVQLTQRLDLSVRHTQQQDLPVESVVLLDTSKDVVELTIVLKTSIAAPIPTLFLVSARTVCVCACVHVCVSLSG